MAGKRVLNANVRAGLRRLYMAVTGGGAATRGVAATGPGVTRVEARAEILRRAELGLAECRAALRDCLVVATAGGWADEAARAYLGAVGDLERAERRRERAMEAYLGARGYETAETESEVG